MVFVGYPLYTPPPHAEGRPMSAVCTPMALDMSRFRAVVGPGWYESSRDLSRGLTVLEGLPAELALKDWLESSRRGR